MSDDTTVDVSCYCKTKQTFTFMLQNFLKKVTELNNNKTICIFKTNLHVMFHRQVSQ